jgi:transcriptional regulator with XRE-family HTH domain
VGRKILAKAHEGIVTTLVNPVKDVISPAWAWDESPEQPLCDMPNRIRPLRLARKLTLEQVAERIGTSVQQLSRLEKGERRLNEDWMRLIATALGVGPADLFADSTPDNREAVELLEEAALIRFWRILSLDERRMIAAFAASKGIYILNGKPRKRPTR